MGISSSVRLIMAFIELKLAPGRPIHWVGPGQGPKNPDTLDRIFGRVNGKFGQADGKFGSLDRKFRPPNRIFGSEKKF